MQAALQLMLALQSQLKETYSPQFSMPVFPSGKSFESGVAPPEYSLPLHSFVSTVVDSDRVDRVDGGDPSVRLDRSANPSHSHSHRLHRLDRVDQLERSEGCENGDGRERSGVVEGSDGVGCLACGKECAPEQEMSKDRSMSGDKKLLEWREPGCEVELQT